MSQGPENPVVHLELHTRDLRGAREFYGALCGWRTEQVEAAGRSYQSLALGDGVGGGVVECGTGSAVWIPYIEVEDLAAATRRAQALGAAVLLDPREGPAGWRSVVVTPAGGEIALWQQKR